MKYPLVTVLIPAYNAEKTLRDTLDSISNQSYQNLEILVIDDGSSDSTYDIASRYEDPRLKVLQIENSGISAALNLGLKLAKGELIARIDSDDLAEKDRIELQVNAFKNNKDLVLLGSSVSYIDDFGKVIGRNFCFTNKKIIKKNLHLHNFFWHPTVMYRTDYALKVGGYENKLSGLFEDYFFFLKLSKYGDVSNLPYTLTKYRISERQITNNIVSDEFKSIMRFVISSESITDEQSERLKEIKRKDKSASNYVAERKTNISSSGLGKLYTVMCRSGIPNSFSGKIICILKNVIARFGLYDFVNCKLIGFRKAKN